MKLKFHNFFFFFKFQNLPITWFSKNRISNWNFEFQNRGIRLNSFRNWTFCWNFWLRGANLHFCQDFYISHKSGIKTFLNWFINKYHQISYWNFDFLNRNIRLNSFKNWVFFWNFWPKWANLHSCQNFYISYKNGVKTFLN